MVAVFPAFLFHLIRVQGLKKQRPVPLNLQFEYRPGYSHGPLSSHS